jgi:hypothetical protein
VIAASRCDARSIHARVFVADTAVATDQAAIAVAAAIRAVIHSTVPADQPVIAVMSAIWLIVGIGSRNVVMKSAVGAVISVRVVSAVGPIVRVSAGMIAGIVGGPRVVAVVIVVTPCVVRNVGVVVIDDRVAATASAPVASPRVKAPTKATAGYETAATASKKGADRNSRTPRNRCSREGDRRRVQRHNDGRAVHD